MVNLLGISSMSEEDRDFETDPPRWRFHLPQHMQSFPASVQWYTISAWPSRKCVPLRRTRKALHALQEVTRKRPPGASASKSRCKQQRGSNRRLGPSVMGLRWPPNRALAFVIGSNLVMPSVGFGLLMLCLIHAMPKQLRSIMRTTYVLTTSRCGSKTRKSSTLATSIWSAI